MGAWLAFQRDRRGSVAMEAAIVISVVLAPIIYGVVGTGHLIATQVRLDRAQHAAMLYAWATPTATQLGIEAAARDGYGAGTPTLVVSAPITCVCMLSTGTRQSGTAQVCGAQCPPGMVTATYMTTSLSAVVDVNLPAPVVRNKVMTSVSTTRIK